MITIKARNVHDMLPEALYRLRKAAKPRDSRNGPVLKFPEPVSLVYEKPQERVIFWEARDANPFFHLAECLWMMSGRNDIAFLTNFAKQIGEYSDDGTTMNGAYGYRWRHYFGMDQMRTVAAALRKNPDCRRQVVAMWDAEHDLGLQSKDLPCNTHIYFSVNEGALDMMVCNRSNDLVWGATGANAVHFSFMQEWMASAVGVEIGKYWQVSNNMHLYTEQHSELLEALDGKEANGFASSPDSKSPYFVWEAIKPFPIISVDHEVWLQDLDMYLNEGVVMGLREPFFRRVVHPMFMAHRAWKTGLGIPRYDDAIEILKQCQASDWQLAGIEWIDRRRERFLKKDKK